MNIKQLNEELNKITDNRRFACVWAYESYQGEHFVIEGIDFFTEEVGYSKEDIEIIDSLEEGELYTVYNIGDDYHVIRLKN